MPPQGGRCTHPQASFDPLPLDFNLHDFVKQSPNCQWVTRVSVQQILKIGRTEFERLVNLHVVQGGKPLVVEKWNSQLPKSLFGPEWLETNYDKTPEEVRDLVNDMNVPMTMGHYLRSLKMLNAQWTSENFRDERRQRLYLKDIDCPVEWQNHLQKILPPSIFYLNQNVERRGTPKDQDGDADMMEESVPPAPAGDLMSSLPPEMRAQNLMCYIGHEGTYTPSHKEMCASLGQNIMVDASGDQNGEKPGSSIWFMTETKDRDVVKEYFLSMLGHDIEIERHFAQLNAWKKATFPVYVVEQKVGDLILVPPLAAHQVWNRGSRTMKVAWNRTTADTLEKAVHEALPQARLVCRDEQYKNKAIIYYTLEKYYKQMVDMETNSDLRVLGLGEDVVRNAPRMKQMAKDFKALFSLFAEIMVDEMFATKEKDVEFIKYDSSVTCSYCRCNIFNRFLTCKNCVRTLEGGDEDTYDVCMECYVMGRSCMCVSDLKWCEQWKWAELVQNHETWRSLVIKNDGYIDSETSPLPLEVARQKSGKKSVAQICQEELKRRPFKDITKAQPAVAEESEPEIDEHGRRKRKKKKKTGDQYLCHVCAHRDSIYRLAMCTNPGCGVAYCYGVLYRAFDLMPQEVMQNEKWQCPKCLENCNCGHCRRHGRFKYPYTPKNTTLGHDTRSIADERSIELLVDFRLTNLGWVKSTGDETRALDSKRMQRLREAAAAEKANEAELEKEVLALPAHADDGDATHDCLGHHDHDVEVAAPSLRDGRARAAEADLSPQGESSYPDPSRLGDDRRIGMGYYEPDDAPDKILFDSFQAPKPGSMPVDERETSDYVKKQIRLARKRARLDNEDPDFAEPRSNARKRHRHDDGSEYDAQAEALNNMDPALFDEDGMAAAASPRDATMEDAPVAPDAAIGGTDGAADQETDDHGLKPYTPNMPSLRHARPKASYAVAADEEEFDEDMDDEVVLFPKKAVQALTNAPGASVSSSAAPKKRGRPRKSDVVAAQAPSSESHGAQSKRRGRPTRSSLAAAASTKAVPHVKGPKAASGTLENQLANELAGFNHDGEMIESGPSDLGGDGHFSDNEVAALKRTRPKPLSSLTVEIPKAKSGPSGESKAKAGPSGESKAKAGPSGGQPMSMAERLRLEGKTFKIKKRTSNVSAATPTTKTSAKESKTNSAPSTVKRGPLLATKAGKKPKPARSKPKRPAMVDLDSSSQEYDPNAPEEELSEDERMPSLQKMSLATGPQAAKAFSTKEGITSTYTQDDATFTNRPAPETAAKSGPVAAKPAPMPLQSTGPTIVRLGSTDEESSYGGSNMGSAATPDDVSSDDDDGDIPALKPQPARTGGRFLRG